MRTLLRVCNILGVAVYFSAAMPVFAESAPVYDADTMQQQFDDAGQQGQQDLPPPPPPDQEGTFVPMQQSPNAAPMQDSSAAQNPVPQNPMPIESQKNVTAGMTLIQRVARIERQLDNMQTGDSSARLDALQSEVQSLRSQVEQLTHQLQQLQDQQKSMFSDLDKRLTQKEANSSKQSRDLALSNDANAASATVGATNISATPPAQAPSKSSRKMASKQAVKTTTVTDTTTTVAKPAQDQQSNGQPNVAEEQQIYQTAYNLIKAKKYNDAVDALQNMLQKYPSGQFASNAHYWLGELYSLMNKNDQALTEFDTVVRSYPSSPRVSDAQLKVGLIYASQSKWSDAKAIFKKVINRYPGTASARIAGEQLKQIKQAGH